ncbi:MAG: hypothetical protein IPG71_02875 [bacterium]|nr:hypothetical protein [bacterium]
MKTSLVWIVSLLLSAQLIAQTEANMCVSVTDVCCNGQASSVDYTIPANQQISRTYFHYEGHDGDRVALFCYDVVEGVESLVWSINVESSHCGCGESSTGLSHPIGQDHHLRFKVDCRQCATGNCVAGSTIVTFASASNYATCLPECDPE